MTIAQIGVLLGAVGLSILVVWFFFLSEKKGTRLAASNGVQEAPDFNKSAKLPPGETVSIEFTPETPGEYDFQCQMGMLHGKLIAE
jgi:plastocyanin domain-containing protein